MFIYEYFFIKYLEFWCLLFFKNSKIRFHLLGAKNVTATKTKIPGFKSS